MPLLLTDRACTESPLSLVTAAEARMVGVPVHSPAFHRVRPGVHVEAQRWTALKPWERYYVRVHAFLRNHPDAILCLESAAVLHGLPLFGESRDIHVYDPDRRSSRRVGDVAVHTCNDALEVVAVTGISVTSMVETVVALARVMPPAQGLAVVDAAISSTQGGGQQLARIVDHAAEQVARRGRDRMRWLWARADGLSESPTESVSRAVVEWSGFERPELQRAFTCEGFLDRGDFFFPSVGAIGESDGWGKYDLRDPIAAERHLKKEKLRENRLRRNGHAVARWTYADAVRVAPLCAALTGAGVAPKHPPQPAMLATLRSSPRQISPTPR